MKTFLEYLSEASVSSSSKDRYEYVHGNKPKGFASWLFSTVHPSKHDMNKDDVFSHSGSFTDAQKAAVSHYKMCGHKGEIHVLT